MMKVTSEELVKAFNDGEITFDGAPKAHPEVTWLAILELSRRTFSDEQIAALAAGPLEDLLVYHGRDFIERIEKESRTRAAFRHLLGGVWGGSIEGPIWHRIEACRGDVW